MTIKVQISSGGREVTIETSGSTVDAVVTKALDAWRRTRLTAADRRSEQKHLEAGGMGFQADIAASAGLDVDECRSRP